jgi:glycosyltransferase involved in cell wall biosynthesis
MISFSTRWIPDALKKEIKLFLRIAREWRYSWSDLGFGFLFSFWKERRSKLYQSVFEKENPLVSVCVATYNRGPLLVQRSVKSLLNQTYQNIEIIVVGDCCTDNTSELMAEITDKRVNYINLSERGVYPENKWHRWMVAGTTPVNHALSLCQGEFITHLDDDDEYPVDRIEKLVGFIQMKRADIVWHPFELEQANGEWLTVKAPKFAFQSISTSSVFYHHWFKSIPWDINAWQRDEPGDWNRFRKFVYLRVKAFRFPESLLYHFREQNQKQS